MDTIKTNRKNGLIAVVLLTVILTGIFGIVQTAYADEEQWGLYVGNFEVNDSNKDDILGNGIRYPS